ncbi:3'-5' exonuclease [Halomonas sabkhae]|uniref:3'-5' exonuclease n=1 Tax=Halomonas sabkhae TaxID=626223 RepID=UPI0025B5EA1F|nr:3'-5' exonuclease [Halomonas sabkhae]MDN3524367.1 3'-5' exonuclease [Halomonas sabkhae]
MYRIASGQANDRYRPGAWMFKVLRRVVDRRRHADSQYGWLFQPYMGDEMVALALAGGAARGGPGALAMAAVCVQGDQVQARDALALNLPADRVAEARRLQEEDGLQRCAEDPSREALEGLLNFVGNRPLVIWSPQPELGRLNCWLRPRFGFDLPNATVDVAHLYQRRQHYWHPQLERRPDFAEAAQRLGIVLPESWTLRDEAVATARLYLGLVHREVPRWRGG